MKLPLQAFTSLLKEQMVLDPHVPDEIVLIYSQLEGKFWNNRNWREMNERDLWCELCLCILSSNVHYETAKSACLHLVRKGLLDRVRMTNKNYSNKIANELSKSLYLPRKKDDSFRKYRFPSIRARQINRAGDFLYGRNSGIIGLLRASDCEIETRDFMAVNIPGLGLKEASHFLRNVGYSRSIAIIGIHIINFLREIFGVKILSKGVSSQAYRILEKIMQDIARTHGLELSILDLAIWQYMRKRC